MSKRILIFSDNHSETKIMNEIITSTPHDLVVHAGDYMVDVATMKLHFDYFVDGNNDYDYKPIQLFTCEKCKFLLVHGDQQFAFDQKLWRNRLRELANKYQANVVIYGHSHIPVIDQTQDITILNPGSISLPRGINAKPSYMIVEVDDKNINPLIKFC